MGTVIEMEKRRRSLMAKRGLQGWAKRFSESFDENTCIRDLSDPVLKALIQAGEESSTAINELVLGVKGMGPGPRFHFLEPDSKMALMDIAIFILDQLRFECMRRLEWIQDYPNRNVPLVDLVERFEDEFSSCRHDAPSLSPSHPRYHEYVNTFEADQGAYIRRMIPEAIQCFLERVQEDGG